MRPGSRVLRALACGWWVALAACGGNVTTEALRTSSSSSGAATSAHVSVSLGTARSTTAPATGTTSTGGTTTQVTRPPPSTGFTSKSTTEVTHGSPPPSTTFTTESTTEVTHGSPPPSTTFTTGSTTATSAPGFDASDPGQGDLGAACVAPTGEPTCTPGEVLCGTGTCDVAAGNVCCGDLPGGTIGTCQPRAVACTQTLTACNEAADCPTGQACCVAANDVNVAIYSCHMLTNGVCPTAMVAAAQACRSNNECPDGRCQVYDCAGHPVEACGNPRASLCTPGAAHAPPPR